MSNISKNLKKARTDAEYTQKQLAEKLGVSQTAVALWENGTREPTLETVERIANILSIAPSYLMGWQDEVLRIDDEIDKIIDRIENENLEQSEISKFVKKITDLSDQQNAIEDNILESDSKFTNNLYNQSSYFDSSEYSEAELKEIKNFAEFLKSKRTPPKE